MTVLRKIIGFFLNFNVGIFLFSIVFLCQFKVRKNGWWILLAGGAVFLGLPQIYRLITQNSFYSSFFFMIGWYSVSYLVLLSFLFLIYYFSFNISAKELLLVLCCSYLLQNIVYNFYQIMARAVPDANPLVRSSINLAAILGVSAAVYVVRKREIIKFDLKRIKSGVIWFFSISLIILLTVISQWASVPTEDENTLRIVIALYAGISAILLLLILISVFSNSWLLHENAVINELFKKAEKQYAISRENVEYINEKVHDLKHQIAALKQIAIQSNQGAEIREKFVELEKVAQVYDDTILTGNNVLDALLTEEEHLCRKNNIQLSFVINGTDLNFIEPIDLYVMFGNALDNAIESVLKIEDDSKRLISISAGQKGKLVRIEFENLYDGRLVFHNGVPRTSKQEESFHGFGIKSIKYIVQKYGGNVAISAENNRFCLSILIPIKESVSTAESKNERDCPHS